MDAVETEVQSKKLLHEINYITKNRFAFVLMVDKSISSLKGKKEVLESNMKINSNATKQQLIKALKKYPHEFHSLRNTVEKIQDLVEAKQLINEFYNLEIKKQYPSINVSTMSLEEKELLLVATEYYEKPISLDSISSLRKYSTEDQIFIADKLVSGNDNDLQILRNKYPKFQYENPCYIMLFKDECLRNIEDIPINKQELLKEIDPEKLAAEEISNSKLMKEVNETLNDQLSDGTSDEFGNVLSSSVTSGLLHGILENKPKVWPTSLQKVLAWIRVIIVFLI